MKQSCLSFIIILVFLFILLRFNRRSRAIPLRYYPILFAVPILLCMFQDMPCILPDKNSLLGYRNEFLHIAVLVTIIFVAVYKSAKGSYIKKFFCFLSDGFLNIIPVSAILLLIYIQLSNSLFPVEKGAGNISAGSNSDLAVCAAIIAACATLYNVQRTLKQESTKNRQAWITSVRFETANLITAVDKIKLYERHHNQNGYFDEDRREQLLDSMIESCTKLRMLINPNDAVAPMLTAQLDAIANYYNENFNDESNHIDQIENVNLRESFMPWVLVLLKVEWERVKAILESREEIIECYYSRDVYEEWSEADFQNYSVNNDGLSLINARLHNIPAENEEERNRVLGHTFPGFHFNDETKSKLWPTRE